MVICTFCCIPKEVCSTMRQIVSPMYKNCTYSFIFTVDMKLLIIKLYVCMQTSIHAAFTIQLIEVYLSIRTGSSKSYWSRSPCLSTFFYRLPVVIYCEEGGRVGRLEGGGGRGWLEGEWGNFPSFSFRNFSSIHFTFLGYWLLAGTSNPFVLPHLFIRFCTLYTVIPLTQYTVLPPFITGIPLIQYTTSVRNSFSHNTL